MVESHFESYYDLNVESLLVLILEDDVNINRVWSIGLSQYGYRVISCFSLNEAKNLILSRRFDVAIVDINLENESGLDFLRFIREKKVEIKTLVVTAQIDEGTAIKALNLNATEFIRKPIGAKEITARLDRLFSYSNEEEIPMLYYRNIQMNLQTQEVYIAGIFLSLSISELKIFRLLLKNAGDVVHRSKLSDALSLSDENNQRTIDSHISRIRKKMDKLNDVNRFLIDHVWGVGYILKAKDD